MMDEQQFKALLEKYINGTCTAEEAALLESWYKTRSQQDSLPIPEARELSDYKNMIWQDITKKTGITETIPVTRTYRLCRVSPLPHPSS